MKLSTQSHPVKEIHKTNWRHLPLEKLRKLARDYSLLREARVAVAELIVERELLSNSEYKHKYTA